MALNNEELTVLLSELFTNMNNLDKTYYDMFYNTTPMDISLERYDENGVLQTYLIPNRAKDGTAVLQGQDSPTGRVIANIGAFYLDTLNYDLYFKSTGNDAYGWVELWSAANFRDGKEYAKLVNNSIPVQRGGTGATTLSGMLKGNGALAVSTAVPGVDYVAGTATVEDAGNVVTKDATMEYSGNVITKDATKANSGNIVTKDITKDDSGNIVTKDSTVETSGNVVTKDGLRRYIIETGSHGYLWYELYNDNWLVQGCPNFNTTSFYLPYTTNPTLIICPCGSQGSSDYANMVTGLSRYSFSAVVRYGIGGWVAKGYRLVT